MTYQPDEAVDVLRAVWSQRDRLAPASSDGQSVEDLEACGPTKSCKNMKDVSFDGMADPGTDLREAWRDRLRREGKLSTAGGSVRDLVLGSVDDGARRSRPDNR
jgi:hypothetical protein